MAILYTIGNKNLTTVKAVSKIIYEEIVELLNKEISKIVIFNTPDTVNIDQVSIYRKNFGNIRYEDFSIASDGFIIAENIVTVFREEGEKFIDLTNGLKTTSAGLYTIGSFLGIENLYYVSLLINQSDLPPVMIRNVHYKYIKLQGISNLSYLSKLSYFDLIYYKEEIHKIIPDSCNLFLIKAKTQIIQGIHMYFEAQSFRSSISECTLFVEVLIKELYNFIKSNPVSSLFCQKNKIILDDQKDPLGAIGYFIKSFSEKGHSNSEFSNLIAITGTLSCLRNYRNISAHAARMNYSFSDSEARTVIHLCIEVLRISKTSSAFWKILINKN